LSQPEHDHAHTHAAPQAGGVLVWALVATLGFALVEAVAGWWSGSLALLGDAGHMATDSASLGLAALAAWLARRPPSARHSYGFGRAEIVAAFVNAVFMLAVIAALTAAAVQRLLQPQRVAGEAVTAVALVGLVVNVLVAWLLSRGEKTMNTRGALLHVLGDLLGSIAALLSGIVIVFTGWMPIDALLSLAICALILVSSMRLLRDALHALMEGTPLHLSYEDVGRAIAGQRGVHSVHDLHIWTLSSHRIALSAHVVVEDLSQWRSVLRGIAQELEHRFAISHITLQPEDLRQPVVWAGKEQRRHSRPAQRS
jgi:cobalt-zinc-cadmium efflux system protein